MNDAHESMSVTAAELRQRFDASFAAPRVAASDDLADYLAIQVAGANYAIQVSDLAGMEFDRKIVSLPTGQTSLLGIAGIQGHLVPVYSLALILGHQPRESESRWLALVGNDERIGLAFDELHGHIRVSRSRVYAPPEGAQLSDHIGAALRIEDEVRYVVDIASVVETLGRQSGKLAATGK